MFQTLGGFIDGQQGIVRLTPNRTWHILLAFESLLQGKVYWEDVRRLLGHAITVCVLNRCGMSIFRALYDFVESRPPPRKLNYRELREVKIFVGLLPLLYGDLRKSWSSQVLCSDASPFGLGLCLREIEQQQVKQIGQWQDKWRFRHLDPSEWRPRQRSQGPNVLSDWRSVLGELEPESVEDLYSYNEYFPEVPSEWTEPSKWKTQLMGRWNDTSSHITEKEGHALVLAVRHLSRASYNRGKKHLVLVDNFSLSMTVCKGRACSFGLLRSAQKIAALSLACDFSIHTRWISSERNVADNPSRGVILPGVAPSSSSKVESEFESVHTISGEASAAVEKADHQSDFDWYSCDGYTRSQEESELQEAGSAASWPCPSAAGEEEKDHLQEDPGNEWCREVSHESSSEPLGEEVHFSSSGKPICRILPEVRQFLPGGRGTTASLRIRRRHLDRLSGPSVSGGKRSARRREDRGQLGVPSHSIEGKAGPCKKGTSWVAKGATTRVPHPHAKDHSLCLGDVAPGPETKGNGVEGDDRLRHLHAPRRVFGPSKATLHQARKAGGPSVPLVLHHCSRLRRPAARQGRSLRQLDPVGQQRADVARRNSESSCADLEGQRSPDLSILNGELSKRVHQGCHETSDQGATPLSTTTRRGSRRPMQQT